MSKHDAKSDKTKSEAHTEDPVLAAEVQRAVEPYRRLFPPDVVATLEEILEHALTTHPVGAELLDAVRPRAVQQRSGNQQKGGVSELGSAKKTGAR